MYMMEAEDSYETSLQFSLYTASYPTRQKSGKSPLEYLKSHLR